MIGPNLSMLAKVFIRICVVTAALLPVGVAAQERGAGGASFTLPAELQGVSISDHFVVLEAEAVGTVQSVAGRLIVHHGKGAAAYYAMPGDTLYEQDILYTLEGSRCRARFKSEDVITMGENSRISVDTVVDNRQDNEKRSMFSMLRGKAMFYVLRLFRHKRVTTDVNTPTAIAGIRGTKFGVEVVRVDGKTASAAPPAPVYLADASDKLPSGLLAQSTAGEGYQTTVYGYDGSVVVTSTVDGMTQSVGPGENVVVGPTGASPVTGTPPAEAQQFSQETEPPAEEGQESGDAGTDTQSGGEDLAAIAIGTTSADTTAMNAEADAANFTAQDPPAPGSGSGVGQIGYFAAMLIDHDFGSPYLDNVYVSSSSQDFGSGTGRADGIYAPGYVKAGGSSTLDMYVQEVSVDGTPTTTTVLGPSYAIDDVVIGSNSYQEWGYWEMPQTFIINTFDHTLLPNYYIVGTPTSVDPVLNGITGEYAGPAYGTYWDAASMTSVDMAGGTSIYVSGPTNEVFFNMSVSDQAQNIMAVITADGHFTGNGGSFTILPGTGNWDFVKDPLGTPVVIPADFKSASGSLYGPNGEFIGGAWGMKTLSGDGAAGIFQGERFGP